MFSVDTIGQYWPCVHILYKLPSNVFISTGPLTWEDICSLYLFHCYLFSCFFVTDVTQKQQKKKKMLLFIGFLFTDYLTDIATVVGNNSYIGR